MKRLMILMLVLALLCAGCGERGHGEVETEEYPVCFVTREETAEGGDGGIASKSVVDWEYHALPPGQRALDGLIRTLLAGPEGEGLASPFPRGTSLRGWRQENGVVTLDLSEAYGGLSGVELTLADACIVLTLCRLEDVEAVYLTVDGRPRPFRDQVLTPADFLLEEGEPGEREVEAALWFPAREELGREERTLRLAAGDRIEVALLQELLSGPESGELDRACPEGTVLRSLSLDGDRAAVNLSARFLEGEEVPLRLWAVVQTLEGVIPGVRVQFQVEGLALEEYGGVKLGQGLKVEREEQ